MADFPQLAQTNENPLAAFYASGKASTENALARDTYDDQVGLSHESLQKAALLNQTTQQDLSDRGVVRDQAGNLTAADPTTQAQAQAQLATHGGGSALVALSSSAEQNLKALQYRQGLFGYPGQSGAPAPDGSGAAAAPGDGASATPPIGQFEHAMAGSESTHNPTIVNAGGYAGLYQMGAPRLAAIGAYTPASGEIGADGKWNGQMNGQFHIPGHPEVKTLTDFLHNPSAQDAAFESHVAGIDAAIGQTPGADKLDPNGLRAVAHLGGIEGMQKFVATGGPSGAPGAFNPGDNPKAANGGTHLSDYYKRFSSGGAPALQQAFGHPQGPAAGRQQAAAPGVTIAPDPAAAATPGASGVQVATRGPMPGDTVSDASPGIAIPGGDAPVTAPAAPADPAGVDAVMSRLRAQQAAAPASPAVPAHTGPLAAVVPDGPLPAAPVNPIGGAAPVTQAAPVPRQVAPVAQPQAAPTAQPQQQPAQTNSSLDLSTPLKPIVPGQAPPGQSYNFARNGLGAYQTAGLPAGFAMARTVDASGRVIAEGPQRIPVPEEIGLEHDRDGGLSVVGKNTGVVYRQVPPRDVATLEHGDPSTPEYAGAYSRTLAAGTKTDANGMVVKPDMRAYAPPTGALPGAPAAGPAAGGAAGAASGGGSAAATPAAPPGTPTVDRSGVYVKDAADADRKMLPALSAQALEQEQLVQKTIEARDAAAKVPTGANFDNRAALANWLTTYAPSIATAVGVGGKDSLLPNPSQAAEAAKLLMGQSTQQEKAFGGTGGLGITKLFADNNPNPNMQGTGIRDMSNLLAVTALAGKDYAQGKASHIGTALQGLQTSGSDGSYKASPEFDKAWFSQDNAHTYYGAVQAMNGAPYETWSKGLSTDDKQRALGVIARIDPKSSVLGRNGHPLAVQDFMPKDMTNPSGVVATKPSK